MLLTLLLMPRSAGSRTSSMLQAVPPAMPHVFCFVPAKAKLTLTSLASSSCTAACGVCAALRSLTSKKIYV